ncbi:hypothetical protein ILUMI_25497 [Ignelater luminosus]|uniref:Zinc transporter ZIP3 n=1 Tax=Ignelater luminosus TaxID=2038154 RepID=A0A8K0FZW3_IGNLU|nr:hypothetical protein ILUMI_25497 [Ignelater luminosus]
MDIVGTKVLVAILFGVIRFIFGILPIHVCVWLKIGVVEQGKRSINEERRQRLDCFIALVQSFGGGVLFATCFLHMMPEVYYSVAELREYGVLTDDYPYSQLVVSFGFFLVYFIEEISQWLIARMPKEPWKKKIKSPTASTKSIITKENKITPQVIIIPNDKAFEEKCEKNKKDFEDNLSVEVVVDEEVQTENLSNLHSRRTSDLETSPEINAELEEIIEEEVKTQQQILRCILIVLALSFHAIFEGLALGLQNSITNIWYLFTAVSIHSATILFCIGLEIFLAGTKPRTIVIHMLLLAVTSPVGVILGLTVSLTTDMHTSAKSFAVVFLEGLSAGTILYITFFEVLSREKERRIYSLRRAAFIGAGFAMMAGLECIKIG